MRKHNRGKILLNFLNRGSEAIGSYYSVLTCRRSHDRTSYFTPREYEFSCTNTPMAIYRRPSFKRRRRFQTEPEVSPPQMEEEEEDVDRDAEEFIRTFYRELKKQNTRFAAADHDDDDEFGFRDPWEICIPL
ncbi:hypothetical protein M569_17390 [Genlisea aurea]|uniref:Uncharacterized protein n=1 Tax=Genlisea aurea TaxID=192259 RepID=S8D458_9LAMI|nr:hypothetical protein M569_17390 [Genlisea aurea]